MAKVELSDHVCDVVFALFDCDGEWGPLETGGKTEPTALEADTVSDGALQTAPAYQPTPLLLTPFHINSWALSTTTQRNISPGPR